MTARRLQGYLIYVFVSLATYLVTATDSSIMFGVGILLALVAWIFTEGLIKKGEAADKAGL